MTRDITEKLRRKILTGQWGDGDTLPNEIKLSLAFEVGRSSVREAVVRLTAEGLLKVRHGKGTKIRCWLRDGSFELLADHFVVAFRTPAAAELLRQVLWLRRSLYTQLATLISAGAPELEKVNTAAWEIRTGNHHGFGWNEGPALLPAEEVTLCAFAAAAGNIPAAMLANSIRRMLQLFSHIAPPTVLPEAIERFVLLASAPTPALIEELCRLREQTYLDLATPKQEEAP